MPFQLTFKMLPNKAVILKLQKKNYNIRLKGTYTWGLLSTYHSDKVTLTSWDLCQLIPIEEVACHFKWVRMNYIYCNCCVTMERNNCYLLNTQRSSESSEWITSSIALSVWPLWKASFPSHELSWLINPEIVWQWAKMKTVFKPCWSLFPFGSISVPLEEQDSSSQFWTPKHPLCICFPPTHQRHHPLTTLYQIRRN